MFITSTSVQQTANSGSRKGALPSQRTAPCDAASVYDLSCFRAVRHVTLSGDENATQLHSNINVISGLTK